MKKSFLYITICLFTWIGITLPVNAQSPQQQEPPTPEEMAAKEADRLGDLLDLEDWQIFYVDSTLQHDYAGLKKEMEDMMKSRVEGMQIYLKVQDKWMDQIDHTYKKIFREDQWKKYLKTGAGKMIKAREKRKEKLARKTAKKEKN